MRLASYNVENLFNRPKVMNNTDWAKGKETLANYSKLNALLGEKTYSAAAKTKMADLMEKLGLRTTAELTRYAVKHGMITV